MTLADNYHTQNLTDHAAPLKKDLSWGLFRRIERDKKDSPGEKIPITLYYDPMTGKRLKESELSEDWHCNYEDAVKALEDSRGYCDGIAFLLTHKDPYHLTIVKGGRWAMEDKDYNSYEWAMYHREMCDGVVEILRAQSTYTFHAPFGSDIYLIGKATRSGNRYKKNMGGRPEYESYDGGWDNTKRRYIPKFVPFSEEVVDDYDVPIADILTWVENNVFEKGRTYGDEDPWSDLFDDLDGLDESLTLGAPNKYLWPPKKVARIQPASIPSENAMPVIANMRCAKWAYENPQLVDDEEGHWGTEQKWKYDRFARSPKSGEKIHWGEENFEKTKHLWGSYFEAYQAYKADEESQGVMLLVEPYRTFRIEGRDHYVVFFDFDKCRNPETGEILPQVNKWIEEMDTYFEVSPSGSGVRGIGFAEKRAGSGSRFKIADQAVEVYGGNQGGRHLITFTGVPITDKPISVVQGWIDEHVPISEADPDNEAVRPEPLNASDEEVMRIMLRSKHGPLIKRFIEGDETLWKGKGSRYDSPSEADYGFFRLLAFYTRKDHERMARIALSSKMRRRRWDLRGYLHKTIEKIIGSCKDVYDPDTCPSGEERQKKKEELLERCVRVCMSLKKHRLRKNFEACVAVANTHGWYSEEGYRWVNEGEYRIPEEGILFYHSISKHGLYTGGKDRSNISKQIKEVREANLLVRIYEGRGFKNSLYLLPKRVMEGMDYRDEASNTITTSLSVFDFYVVNPETPSPFQKLVWIQKPTKDKPGLNDNHKLLIKCVLLGEMEDVDELVEFFGISKRNFKSRVLKLPLEIGLLKYEGETKNRVRLPENFEEILHRLYVDSGGEEAHNSTAEQFSMDSKKNAERCNASGSEQSAPLEVTLGRLGMTMEDWQRMKELERRKLFWSWQYYLAATA